MSPDMGIRRVYLVTALLLAVACGAIFGLGATGRHANALGRERRHALYVAAKSQLRTMTLPAGSGLTHSHCLRGVLCVRSETHVLSMLMVMRHMFTGLRVDESKSYFGPTSYGVQNPHCHVECELNFHAKLNGYPVRGGIYARVAFVKRDAPRPAGAILDISHGRPLLTARGGVYFVASEAEVEPERP